MAEHWIQDAVPKSHEGLFTAKANKAGESVGKFAQEHIHDSGKLGAQARFAANMRGLARKKTALEEAADRRK